MNKYSRCRNCNGEEVFNPDSGMLMCERCGSVAPVKEGKKNNTRRMYDPALVLEANYDLDVVYKCTTCGTKSIVGLDGEVKRCSSCGNVSLAKEKTNLSSPDGVIPFSVSRKKACEIFRNWVGSRKFAPNDLKQMAKLEKISGLYSPVYNFNYNEIIRYSGIGIKKKIDGDGNEIRKEYEIKKIKENNFENILKTANTRITDSFIEGLGEYNFNELRPYSTDYILGFAGMDTNIDIHKIYNDLVEESNNYNMQKIKNKLEEEYDYLENFSCNTRFKDVSFNYSYLPVWANHYTYKGKEYHCYINGQTGKATGSAPKSILKIAGTILGVLGGIGLGILLIACLI